MASITASWTENVSLGAFDDTSPADGVASVVNLDIASGGYDRVLVQLTIDWGAGATDYADVNFYGSSDSGSTISTIAAWSERISALNDTIGYYDFLIIDMPYVRIEVDNQSNAEIESLTGIYAGRTWTSA